VVGPSERGSQRASASIWDDQRVKIRSVLPHPSFDASTRGLALRFTDAEVERDFVDADNRAAVDRARFMAMVAFVLSIPFGAIDLVVLRPDHVANLMQLRGVGLVALLLVIAAATWWASAPRYIQVVTCGAVALYSWCTVAAVLLTPIPRTYATVGTVLLMLGLVGLVRVRFRSALLTALATFPVVLIALFAKQGTWDAFAFEAASVVTYGVLILTVAFALERSKRTAFLANRALEAERQRSDDLLHSILPEPIAQRLRENPTAIAESASETTVLFADIVGFTSFASELPPNEVVELLDLLFGKFDDLCDEHSVEKVKTIGDAYMAVAGIPRPDPDHAGSIVELAFDMQRAATAIAPLWPTDLKLRMGISSGPVVAGVIGRKRFAYDMWGDTVNTASRMESHGEPNRIQVSDSTYALLKDRYAFGDPQKMDIKGKGPMTTYFLLGPEPY